jgi:phenylalanyl-tRNA synthetase alpha chain
MSYNNLNFMPDTSTPDQPNQANQPTISSQLQAFIDQADQIKKQLPEETLNQEELQQKYLGKNGLFKKLAEKITDLDDQEKRQAGQILNHLKDRIENYIQELTDETKEPLSQRDLIDLTLPGKKPFVGHVHPISQAMEEISRIFEKIGFVRVRYPEVDWDWYAFESLNMPQDHPARDEWETFFVDQAPHTEKGKVVLTPHTSNGQVREMERVNQEFGGPTIRMINIARCYRRQQDVTHTQMFHQFEGLVIDTNINIQHLKGTIDYFAREFYGPEAKSRIRPFHFKFTEPSFEVDFSCHLCGGTGYLETDQGREKCRFCKSGWHEVGGAGMVHPNVLRAGGIDPEKYQGFAFGWGIERTYTLRKGLNIDDIRLLYSANLNFLQQF